MSGLGVDVFESRELQAALVALKVLPKEVTVQTRKHTKRLVDAEWRDGLSKRAVSHLQKRVLVDSAVSSVTNSNVSMKSATKGRVGRNPSHVLASGSEFGADREAYTRYSRRSKNGGSHTVTRRLRRGFGWHRGRQGRVVFPTAQDLAPRIASMYVQTLLRTTAEAFEN